MAAVLAVSESEDNGRIIFENYTETLLKRAVL